MREALEGIIRWCTPSLKYVEPSRIILGVTTPTGEAVLAENIIRLATAALDACPVPVVDEVVAARIVYNRDGQAIMIPPLSFNGSVNEGDHLRIVGWKA